jgi:hypothetical protein
MRIVVPFSKTIHHRGHREHGDIELKQQRLFVPVDGYHPCVFAEGEIRSFQASRNLPREGLVVKQRLFCFSSKLKVLCVLCALCGEK